MGGWILFKFLPDNHYYVWKLWEKKKLRFITKIRDFGNFAIFWSKVNPPGYVVIDFGFNAFFTFFASNLEDKNKKNWQIKAKTHLKFDFRFWLNWVLYCQLLQCYVWYRKFCFGQKSSEEHQNLLFLTICSNLWSIWGTL